MEISQSRDDLTLAEAAQLAGEMGETGIELANETAVEDTLRALEVLLGQPEGSLAGFVIVAESNDGHQIITGNVETGKLGEFLVTTAMAVDSEGVGDMIAGLAMGSVLRLMAEQADAPNDEV